MQISRIKTYLRDFWQEVPQDEHPDVISAFYLVLVGFFVGLCAGTVVAFFRLTSGYVYTALLRWTGPDERNSFVVWAWVFCALMAAYIVGKLIKNPAIRFGGSEWVREALKDGQPRSWRKILVPKFIGSWLVMACGVSVGSEGPSIQMGSATAVGLKNFDNQQKIERSFFIIGGGGAGLAAAFSAPFAGICWAYEIIKAKMSVPLFLFMLAGGFGVYVACEEIFELGTRLPLGPTPMPGLFQLWILIPLGVFAGIVGIAYNYLLRISIKIYARQKLIPVAFRPFLPFAAAALLVMFYPAITGEGFTIFPTIEAGHAVLGYLCVFLALKLVFTAFCYGSGIPAGVMVPVLCVGGVMGAIYEDWVTALGLLSPDYGASCIVMGMAGSFAAAERAPVTALVLVAETTGAFGASLGILLTAAIGSTLGRLARTKAA